jgi:hypothetical protein
MFGRPTAAVVLALAAGFACSSEKTDVVASPDGGDAAVRDAGQTIADSGTPDAEPEDLGTARDAEPSDADATDTGPPDSGLRGACGHPGATCIAASECGAPQAPPSSCDSCVEYYRSLCIGEACETPPMLEAGDVYTVAFTVDANVPRINSLVWYAVAAAPPFGPEITCDEVYARAIDLGSGCFNVLDVRLRDIVQPGDTYTVTLGNFAAGLRTLFIVYAHDAQRGEGMKIGISCTAYDVAAPGSGPISISGGPMRRL